MRRPGAADQAVRQQLYRRGACVADRVADSEHIVRIDADRAAEDQSFTVVPSEGNRIAWSELAVRRGPARLRPWNFDVGAGGDPAEFGEVGILRPRRRQQLDLGALRIDGLVVVRERQIVEPGPQQINRAVQTWRRDLDARLFGEGGFAGLKGMRRCSSGSGGARSVGRSPG